MANHSHTLAWEIPWTEEPGRLQSVGLQKRHNSLNSDNNKEFREYILDNHFDNLLDNLPSNFSCKLTLDDLI